MSKRVVSAGLIGIAVVWGLASGRLGETYAAVDCRDYRFVLFERWAMPDLHFDGTVVRFRSQGHAGTFDGRRVTIDGRSVEVPTGILAVWVRNNGNALVVSVTRPGREETLLTVPHRE
jgi:hypothetical protein